MPAFGGAVPKHPATPKNQASQLLPLLSLALPQPNQLQARGAACTAPPVPTWNSPSCRAATTLTPTAHPSPPAGKATNRLVSAGCACRQEGGAALALTPQGPHAVLHAPPPLLPALVNAPAGRRRTHSWQPGCGSGVPLPWGCSQQMTCRQRPATSDWHQPCRPTPSTADMCLPPCLPSFTPHEPWLPFFD